MHMEARVLFEPGLHFRMFVRGVVVDDQVQLKVLGRFPIDFLEEVQPLMPFVNEVWLSATLAIEAPGWAHS